MDRDSRGAVIASNEAINRRDRHALAGLMTDDHLFVDSAGARVVDGRSEARCVTSPSTANRERVGI